MVMETIQIRLNKKLVQEVDALVKDGSYSSRSEAIRDAVRHQFWHSQVGIIENKGDAVKQIRKIREKLSKEPIDLDEINSLTKVFWPARGAKTARKS